MEKAVLASLVFSILAAAAWIASWVVVPKQYRETAIENAIYWSLPVFVVAGGVSSFIALRNK